MMQLVSSSPAPVTQEADVETARELAFKEDEATSEEEMDLDLNIPPSEAEPMEVAPAAAQPEVFNLYDLYESIKPEHKEEADEPLGLEATLRSYQRRALRWMLNRELDDQEDDTCALWEETINFHTNVRFFRNLLTNETMDHLPDYVKVRGGILAEEMGLGKTVEVIALILAHPKTITQVKRDPDSDSLYENGATLIITPSSILQQWKNELTRHAPTLRVEIYQGHQMHTVEALGAFDVVLTDYDTMKSEVHYSKTVNYALRHEKKYEIPLTPLLESHWWRVVLDEAQFVDSPVTQTAEMAQRISAANRWCVTGTPIGMHGLDDLFGLLLFLRHDPFSQSHLWNNVLKKPYERGDTRRLHRFLRSIMWRHSKAHVIDEIDIPSCKKETIHLSFSAVEEEFYQRLLRDVVGEIRTKLYLSVLKESDLSGLLLQLRQACCHPQLTKKSMPVLSSSKVLTMDSVMQNLINEAEDELQAAQRDYCRVLNQLAAAYLQDGRIRDSESLYSRAWDIEDNIVISRVRFQDESAVIRPWHQLSVETASCLASILDRTGSNETKRQYYLSEAERFKSELLAPYTKKKEEIEHVLHASNPNWFEELVISTFVPREHDTKVLRLLFHRRDHPTSFFTRETMQAIGREDERLSQLRSVVRKFLEAARLRTGIVLFQSTHKLRSSSRSIIKSYDACLTQLMASIRNRRQSLLVQCESIQNGSDSPRRKRRRLDIDDAPAKLAFLQSEQRDNLQISVTGPSSSTNYDVILEKDLKSWTRKLNKLEAEMKQSDLFNHELTLSFPEDEVLTRDRRGKVKMEPGADSELNSSAGVSVRKTHKFNRRLKEEMKQLALTIREWSLEQLLDMNNGFSESLRVLRVLKNEEKERRALHVAIDKLRDAELELAEATRPPHFTEAELNFELTRLVQEESAASAAVNKRRHRLQYLTYKRTLWRTAYSVLAEEAKAQGESTPSDASAIDSTSSSTSSSVPSNVAAGTEPSQIAPSAGSVSDSSQTSAPPQSQRSTNSSESASNSDPTSANDEFLSCSICLERSRYPALTMCAHLYCSGCINKLLEGPKKQCAVCREPISKSSLYQIGKENRRMVPVSSPESRERLSRLGTGDYSDVNSIDVRGSYSTKIEALVRNLLHIKSVDPLGKSLVFSQWTGLLDIIASALRENGITFESLSGAAKKAKHQAVDRFQNDPNVSVFLLSTRTDASGLTLVAARYVFLMEPSLNAAIEEQAINRVHRIGQTQRTYVKRFIIKDSIEERVLEWQTGRTQLGYTALKKENKETLKFDEMLQVFDLDNQEA